MSAPFVVKHYEGTLVANIPLKVSLNRMGHGLHLTNTDAVLAINVSFNGGRNYYPVNAGQSLILNDIVFHYFNLISTGAATWVALTKEG